MAHRNVFINLVRSLDAKLSALNEQVLAREEDKMNHSRRNGSPGFFSLLMSAASDELTTDANSLSQNAALMSTDELRAIESGMISATEVQRAEASAILSTRD